MDATAGPMRCVRRADSFVIEPVGNLAFGVSFLHEPPVDLPDEFHLFRRSLDQDHAVGLKTLVFASLEDDLGLSALVEEHPPKSEASRPALSVAVFDQFALAPKHLNGEFTTVLPRHRALDTLDDG